MIAGVKYESGAVLMELSRLEDARGWTMQTGVPLEMESLGVPAAWPFELISYSREKVLRGMHHQPGLAKLIHVTRGAVHEVVVDLRRESFGLVESYFLHAERQLYVPPWCAHGFLVRPIGPDSYAEVHYRLSGPRNPAAEVQILWSSIDHEWPATDIFLSTKDRAAPTLEMVRDRMWPAEELVSQARGA
jgi:dTDP-4-dehydrorhamnose 3,5-epimerase